MLKEISTKDKVIISIYEGQNEVWKKPRAEAVLDSLYSGGHKITGRAYPNYGTVSIAIKYNNGEYYETTTSVRDLQFSKYLEKELGQGDFVTVQVSHPGYQSKGDYKRIY